MCVCVCVFGWLWLYLGRGLCGWKFWNYGFDSVCACELGVSMWVSVGGFGLSGSISTCVCVCGVIETCGFVGWGLR